MCDYLDVSTSNETEAGKNESGGRQRSSLRREMPLSCQRCRVRKVKCNFAHPCSSCVKLGVECIAVPNDMRKKRPPANYVSTLEKQIDTYQKFFAQLKKISSPLERSEFFDAHLASMGLLLPSVKTSEVARSPVDGNSGVEKLSDENVRDENRHNGNRHSGNRHSGNSHQNGFHNIEMMSGRRFEFEPSAEKDIISHVQVNKIRPVYGPTSVYENGTEFKSRANSTSVLQKKESRELATLKALSKDPDVLHCLKLFFTWQYPNHNMFVFREAFFIDFFNPKPNLIYCSSVLVLSACALGARMSDVDSIYSRSITYYNEAKSLLLSSMEYPSITSVQSFLLLAFYDICNGHNSTGWMLSGNAMRMGFDLGFQLNPESWFLKHRGRLEKLDVSIRSRIYWGCFMADHFISLVLGRPSLLKFSDTTIPETEDLPELSGIDEFKYVPENVTNISDPLKNIINLISISDNMLHDIFTKTDSLHNQDIPDDYDLISRVSKLFQYNAQIKEWKNNLPPDLNWDRENLKATSDNPTISVVRYYYYILILCLNRPFVGIKQDFGEKAHLSPAHVCASAIEDLYEAIQNFERAHGLRRASIFIVYCSILSISVILLTATTGVLKLYKKVQLKYFMNVLQGCSKTWRLAEKSHKLIAMKLSLRFANDPDFKVPVSDLSKKEKPRVKRQKKGQYLVKVESVDSIGKTESSRATTSMSSSSELTVAANTDDETLFKRAADDAFGVKDAIALDNEFRVLRAELEQFSNLDQASSEFFGGPPVLMTSDLFSEDWEALFADSSFSQRIGRSD